MTDQLQWQHATRTHDRYDLKDRRRRKSIRHNASSKRVRKARGA